ncbi:MAG: hypothetical protein LW808_002390 [Verrucomicrobiota bacterium]|nr:MAG: hypothetical protein LW808_002390 [Verrucomicrobiota bacterium]
MMRFHQKDGFILALTASVLAMLTTILVGYSLLALLQKQQTAGFKNEANDRARRNALQGLQMALAQLQATTGSDCTATAKAQILPSCLPKCQHWIGAWRVRKCDETVPDASDEKTFLSWLVSGDQSTIEDVQQPKSFTNILSFLENVDPVDVPLVDVEKSDFKGQYAYWIEDQSFKIATNRQNSDAVPELWTRHLRVPEQAWFVRRQCPQQFNIAMMGDQVPEDFDVAYFLALARGDSETVRTYRQKRFHHLTRFSWGLLTDTRTGGFRKNLRYGHNYLQEIPEGAFLFTPPTTYPAPPPTWDFFKSFVSLEGKDLLPIRATYPLYNPQAGVDYSSCQLKMTSDGDYVTGQITGRHAADLGIATQYGVYPIMTEFLNNMSLRYVAPSDVENAATPHDLLFRAQVGFHLENPFNRPLSGTKLSVAQEAPSVECSQMSSKSYVHYQKTPTFRCKLLDVNGATLRDGLLGDYVPNWGADASSGYLRRVWGGALEVDFSQNTSRYLVFKNSGYESGKSWELTLTDSMEATYYSARELRIDLSGSPRAASCWWESYPQLSGQGNCWPNLYDSWDHLYLRVTDRDNRVLQQISDLPMGPGNVRCDRNFAIAIGALNGQMIPLYGMHLNLKQAPSTSPYKTRPFLAGNPHAPVAGRTACQDAVTGLNPGTGAVPGYGSWETAWRGLSDADALASGSIKLANTWEQFNDYSRFRSILDLPEAHYKLLNLGFLQHMNVGVFSYHPLYAIGNSFQNPWIERDRFFQENPAFTNSVWPSHHRVELLYDYSYALNRALWDHYFIASTGLNRPTILVNPRQKAWVGADEEALYSFHDAAKNLVLRGAFNVNNTSAEAWAALLGSTAGAITGDTRYVEYSRIQTSPDPAGLRQLEQQAVWDLAQAVVQQIQRRGVAGSLGEFINRKLVSKEHPDAELGLKGALQAAIDATNTNAEYGGENVISQVHSPFFDDEAASGPTWAGAPGFLTQADLLQSIGTVLCARGDTFKIYVYGNTLDDEGQVLAETHCEALVQRFPEWLDADKPELGRRYQVLSMRWHSPKNPET